MNTSKIIGAILIIVSIGMAYMGYTKISENTQQVNILGLKIDASNESGKQEGYMYLGFAAILFLGGIYTVNKAKNQFSFFITCGCIILVSIPLITSKIIEKYTIKGYYQSSLEEHPILVERRKEGWTFLKPDKIGEDSRNY